MLRINQIKLKVGHSEKELRKAVYKALRLNGDDKCEYTIFKRSIDARKKPDIYYVYSIDITEVMFSGKKAQKAQIIKRAHNKNLIDAKEEKYEFIQKNTVYKKVEEINRPVIIGFGPAGIFAALKLAEAGLKPVVYERGSDVDARKAAVDSFWTGGRLDTECNVQFGEGGAGTFSDGKLNTMIKDPSGRIRETLKVFVKYGADSSILYVNKPHIGTDVLADVVKNIREHIKQLGGEVNFNMRLDNIDVQNGAVSQLAFTNTRTGEKVLRKCENVCLAIGHSARDTFEMLNEKKCMMEPKAFAVGLRLEHPQEFVNYNAYGQCEYNLPAADYKVTYQTSKGRGVYSFCMCPGGYVVNASSEEGRIAVNGMSYSGRDGSNANSAIIVTVKPEDFGFGVLDGMKFQRKLEGLAYDNGKGKIPVQLLGDFNNNRISTGFGKVTPCIKGEYEFADLRNVLPSYISEAVSEGVTGIAAHFKGFDMEDAVFSGVESRTSSPVRIVRNDNLESPIKGLFPCGEGAGYAGGITSAAVDGMKVAEKIAVKMAVSSDKSE